MTSRDLDRFRAQALAALRQAGETATLAEPVEAALSDITKTAYDLLGDREVHLRPGALKEGEVQFFVCGIFLLRLADAGHILVAEHSFPAEQHRLTITIDMGHPGHVWRTKRPLILANTDEHADFKQILKTARMGSALYAPMFWRGEMIGQIICAAQARNTFQSIDLDVLCAFANLASLAFVAGEGMAWRDALERAE